MIYPKLKQKKDCAFPERLDCNVRCEYMKYNNSKSIDDPDRWECTFKKNIKKRNEKTK